MGRSKVSTSFLKVDRRKRRQTAAQELPEGTYDLGEAIIYMRLPSGEISPLGRYIEDNRDSGLPVHELIEQFQEYDCDHEQMVQIGSFRGEILARCTTCALVCQKIFRPDKLTTLGVWE